MKRRSRSEWQALISEQSQSDLNVSDFCKQHDLSPASFYYQRQRCQTVPSDVSPFIEVRAASPATSYGTITLQGAFGTLSFPSNTDSHWLASLLRSLS